MSKLKGQQIGLGTILLVLGAIWLVSSGAINTQSILGGTPAVASTSGACPDTKATNLDVRIKNALNSSEDYAVGNPTLVAFRAGAGGAEQTRGTATAAGSYTTLTVDCGATYDVYALGVNSVIGAGVNSVSLKGVPAVGRSVQKTIDAYQMGYPNCKVTNVNYDNLTAADDITNTNGWHPCGAGTTLVTTAAETFNSGTSNNYHLQFETNTSGNYGAYGSNDEELRTFLAADFNTGVFSLSSGVTINGLSALASVPNGAPANDGFDKVWVIPAIKSTDSMRDYFVNIKADLGNPSGSDDVTFRLYDEQWYVGADGTIKKGTVNDAATDTGATNVGVQVAMG